MGKKRLLSFVQDEVMVVPDNSTSMAGRPLPPLPCHYDVTNSDTMGSILLFYQYKEPMWTESEFHKVLKKFLALGNQHEITGRGRIATEGVNCTLTGASPNIRAFCRALREQLDTELFRETDFKITDNVPKSQLFKSLSMRKTDELVAYGLEKEKAPSIKKFGGIHLNALDYHKALQDPNTVVIDVSDSQTTVSDRSWNPHFSHMCPLDQVRNQYETAIGTMKPPPGGARLIDPKLRNSHEWPKWLAAKETQQQLHGKKVMMFCTGGIRCERAAALVNQMALVSSADNRHGGAGGKDADADTQPFQPQGVYHMQGGIERYLRTFPTGGFWSGKNYLFDKRMEQIPEHKDALKVEQEVSTKLKAKCSRCRQPWTSYRGKYKCSQTLCGVPVIVCETCQMDITKAPQEVTRLQCELCREGYRAPQQVPDLVALRLKAEKLAKEQRQQPGQTDSANVASKKKDVAPLCVDRLFLSRLPLNVRKAQIEQWLRTPVHHLEWLTDKQTGAFYGSCIVQVDEKALTALLEKETREPFPGTLGGGRKRKRRQQPKIAQVMAREGHVWPPEKETEFPPLGHHYLVQ
jgi:predicted sulfurtransferase